MMNFEGNWLRVNLGAVEEFADEQETDANECEEWDFYSEENDEPAESTE